MKQSFAEYFQYAQARRPSPAPHIRTAQRWPAQRHGPRCRSPRCRSSSRPRSPTNPAATTTTPMALPSGRITGAHKPRGGGWCGTGAHVPVWKRRVSCQSPQAETDSNDRRIYIPLSIQRTLSCHYSQGILHKTSVHRHDLYDSSLSRDLALLLLLLPHLPHHLREVHRAVLHLKHAGR